LSLASARYRSRFRNVSSLFRGGSWREHAGTYVLDSRTGILPVLIDKECLSAQQTKMSVLLKFDIGH
jgi:hypothetical protein